MDVKVVDLELDTSSLEKKLSIMIELMKSISAHSMQACWDHHRFLKDEEEEFLAGIVDKKVGTPEYDNYFDRLVIIRRRLWELEEVLRLNVPDVQETIERDSLTRLVDELRRQK